MRFQSFIITLTGHALQGGFLHAPGYLQQTQKYLPAVLQVAGGRLTAFLNSKYFFVEFNIRFNAGKIVKGFCRNGDQHVFDKVDPFRRALRGVLDTAFPLQHCSGFVADFSKFGEYLFEINRAVTKTAESPRTLFPVLVSAVDAAFGR